jgi:endoglycosylceramidase
VKRARLAPRPLALVALVAAPLALACSSSKPSVDAPDAAAPSCTATAGAFAPLATRCGQLVDAQGRVVVLHGVNARVRGLFDVDLGAGKKPRETVPVVDATDLARMRAVGFDLVRLPIHWSAIEPDDTTPPTYVASYLDAVAAFVADAKKAGVQVLLDFHQDAYSKWFGQDGAPLWAIVPPLSPASIVDGPIDLGAATISQPVLAAFTTFFSRSSADGARLRARYAQMAAKVAARFAGDETVVGIELMNEPSAADDELRAFDEELGAAIRAVDPQRLVFFEPPASRNIVDYASVPTSPLGLDGVVYAPHVYTGVFRGGAAFESSFTKDDLRPSNVAARDEADAWGAPLFVGEFGYGPSSVRYADYIGAQLALQDESMASSAYWVWKEDPSEGQWGFYDYDATAGTWKERDAVRKVFARVVPRAIAGWPTSWKFDAATRRFELRYQGDAKINAPTVLHLPAPEDAPASGWRLSCDGAALAVTPDAHGDLSVTCNGAGAHVVMVSPK